MTRTLALGALALTLGLASPLATAHDDNAAYFLLGAAVGSTIQQERGAYRGSAYRHHGQRYVADPQRHRWRATKRHHRRHHARHHAHRDHRFCHDRRHYQVHRNGVRQDYWRDEESRDHRHYRDDRDRPRRYR